MSKIDDGGPVFPFSHKGLTEEGGTWTVYWQGMSLRDWLAGQALAGMHARDSYDDGLASPKQRARLAYIDADAMIEARKVKP
jgi:hypothetical protein